jgi:hypothetical protein
VNRHDGVLRVVLASEKLLDFGRVDLFLQPIEMFLEVLGNRLPFFSPLDERAHLLLAVVEMPNEIEIALQATAFAGKVLGPSRVGPDRGVG